MKLLLGTVLSLAAAVGTAHAARFSALDGNRLIGLCAGRDRGMAAECTAFINGVSDAASSYQELRPADGSKGDRLPAYICVPTEVTGVQMRQTVISWARAHPESQGLQASGVVLRALHDSYKCQNTGGGMTQ